jgi:hypothetical protein
MAIDDEKDGARMLAFRCPEQLASAAEAAAAREMLTVSAVVRRALLRDLQGSGFASEVA